NQGAKGPAHASDVPEADGGVSTTRGQDVPAPTERHAGHLPRVALKRVPALLTRGEVPKANRAVRAARGQDVPARAEGQTGYLFRVEWDLRVGAPRVERSEHVEHYEPSISSVQKPKTLLGEEQSQIRFVRLISACAHDRLVCDGPVPCRLGRLPLHL